MTITVQPADSGKRIDLLVSEKTELTRAHAQKMLEDGNISVNGKTVAKSYKVSEGDAVEVTMPEPEPLEVKSENIPLDIVYEDDDIIVINKPKGIVVHPAAGNREGTLVNALLYHCGSSLSGIGGVIRPGIVHRIDKLTSGLLVVAKNDFAHVALSEQIKKHEVSRIYHAVVIGGISENRTIDCPIGRHPVDRKKMAVTTVNSKPAVTHIEPIEQYAGATYVRCILETGRTHQIRVHLSHIGHPVLGDQVYGGIKNPVMNKFGAGLEGQCLHAKELMFVHPRTGEKMHFECDLPDYFNKILDGLRRQQ